MVQLDTETAGVAVMTEVFFHEQMDRLSGLRFAPSDLTTHWEALSDIPQAVLEAAVTRAQLTRSEFPTPVELRQDADVVAHLARPVAPEDDRSTPLAEPFTIDVPQAGKVISVTREWKYFCDRCDDSGVESLWCGEAGPSIKPWQTRQACERTKLHLPHEWARKCICFESNPALVKKRERQQKYAETAKPKRAA